MQKFELIQAFRDWSIGDIFIKNEDGRWSYNGEFQNQRSHTLDTLLDVGGYLQEIVKFTPTMGDTFFYITGAGEVKEKEWTNSDWCNSCRDFLGVFATREEAQDAVISIRELIA